MIALSITIDSLAYYSFHHWPVNKNSANNGETWFFVNFHKSNFSFPQ